MRYFMPLSSNISSLIPVIGTILSVRPQTSDCRNQMISLATDNGPVNAILSSDTTVVNSTRLRPSMRIVAYYDGSRPMPLIFPPQYQAVLVAVLRPGEQVLLGRFDRNLTSQNPDQPLRLNIAPSTTIQTLNGQNSTCPLDGRTLLVFYSNTTRSIPPQTTPRKVIVLSV